MSAIHTVDDKKKLIITAWEGEPTAQDLTNAFKQYQKEIKSEPSLADYNELVDFTKIVGFKINSNGLRILANVAANSDDDSIKTKLAIVVKSPLTFGLARMYEIYRDLNPTKSKEIKVFQNKSSALIWLDKANP